MSSIKNYEFKAKVTEIDSYEQALLKLNPFFKGIDHQIDTYFNSSNGRLKLREGNIENSLIQYHRENVADSKLSTIKLYKHKPSPTLKEILVQELGIKVVVDKKRKIYFIDNVKFHFDEVKDLGFFIEVEAIDDAEKFTVEELQAQCYHYQAYFQITVDQYMPFSYSDLLLNKIEETK